MSGQDVTTKNQSCCFFHFGLIVTGEGERNHLPKLFKSLMATGVCTFEIIFFIGQRSQRTSKKRILRMIDNGKIIPDRDQIIGLKARRYLTDDNLKDDLCHFVILIDDLEHDRRDQAQQVFDRYRLALDTVLTQDQKRRASAHFLVNMLEAYYFADASAINAVLGLKPSLEDYKGDVETIRHPKSKLKKLYRGFRVVNDGGKILDCIDIEHVLSQPDTCVWLRTLFAWCVKILERHPYSESWSLSDKYCLRGGILSGITQTQLDNLNLVREGEDT